MADPDYRLLDNLIKVGIEQEMLKRELLKSDGGDGTSGGMEARVARLESDMEHVKKSVSEIATDLKATRSTISDLKVDFGRFDERLKHMPTKGFIFATSAAMIAAMGGLVALIVRFLPHAG